MKRTSESRRKFIRTTTIAGLGLSITGPATSLYGSARASREGKRVGIIGLDTSHSTAFTKAFNDPAAKAELGGYRVAAAYPQGSRDIESSVSRIPAYTEEVKKLGVEITGSIEELLDKVDVVMLETNDGRLHLEQALPVFKAGKTLFIDKPVAASLSDALRIFEAADEYKVPVFSASSLRYMGNVQEVREGKIGKVLGADTYSPATIEKTHPDLFWYGVHGVEALFTVMGTGCKSVSRVHTEGTDIVTGIWEDGRVGTFRGTRTGKHAYGGTAYGEKGNAVLGPYNGYLPLLVEIVRFFETGEPPVEAAETLEIFAFMEAADESKRKDGETVMLESVIKKAKRK
ncbi:putative dehydrogenase [Anseongella ginsenosidimutans]|uniref:Putative dehydrogenase n=1 Tax=Anseongella ginsenosidimutans TaxID=496056 RepID=A0A4R3KSP7_9SPHI|nr:Gfo/Idh/MocA family oxidoreductase [Anseongella ginsenosidimutans]QEC52204.1 Gfo/Idh/MocA family oxidoreductase [Anseongella ginsenosidimutans]TCS86751.1 putative dehydrogenase [Anseongella ginsenosidimutans]